MSEADRADILTREIQERLAELQSLNPRAVGRAEQSGGPRPPDANVFDAQDLISAFKASPEDRQNDEAFRNEKAAVVTEKVKAAVENESVAAKKIREKKPTTSKEQEKMVEDAQTPAASVQIFVDAYKNGLITRPAHAPTRKLFDSMASVLAAQLEVPPMVAIHLYPIIHGFLHQRNYVAFSLPGQQETSFESNLDEAIANPYVREIMSQIFMQIFNRDGENAFPNITRDQLEAKFKKEKTKQVLAEVEGTKTVGDQEKEHLRKVLLDDVSEEEAGETIEILEAMEKIDDFYLYFKKKYRKRLADLASRTDISEENKKKRASKDVAAEIHTRLMSFTYKIYTPILNGDPRKGFGEVNQENAGMYGTNPATVYSWLKKSVGRLYSVVDRLSPGLEEGDDIPFFQYGNEDVETYYRDDARDDDGEWVRRGKMIHETRISSDLKEVASFSKFLENIHVAMETENGHFMAGIQYNSLLLTNKLSEGQSTFFKQAGQYAKEFLKSGKIDELYKLPYHEVIESAKIAMSSYYKREFAFNEWERDPKMLQGIFERLDKVQEQVLEDMIAQNKSRTGTDKVPDWAIKRAIIHARTHLSLLDLDMHALASYAHAPVTDLGNPTFRDPVLKNLEVFRTWYAYDQWRTTDASLKGMAFLPAPTAVMNSEFDSRSSNTSSFTGSAGLRKYKRWIHEDVTGEGEEIYKDSRNIGKLSRVGREYFDWDIAPNIMELNPMNFGGIEIQNGWRIKYPAMPWLTDLLNLVTDEEHMKMSNTSDLTEGWKRLENIGTNVIKMYRDNFLFGDKYKNLKMENGRVKYEDHFKDFYKFLFRRYFSNGVGKSEFKVSFINDNLQEIEKSIGDFGSDEEFWEEFVRPLINRKAVKGKGETDKGAEGRNLDEKGDTLKAIVNHAMTVMGFERMPMDFVYIEDPSRSQNGITLLRELQNTFIHTIGVDDATTQTQKADLKHAFDDIVHVQQAARDVSVQRMNALVKDQNDRGEKRTNVFANRLDDINSREKDRSDIRIVDGETVGGYAIDHHVVRKVLEERWGVGHQRVEKAVRVFQEIERRVMQKPGKNKVEITPEVSDVRLKYYMREKGADYNDNEKKKRYEAQYAEELKVKFQNTRDHLMRTRLGWSGEELLSGKTVFTLHDTAYQFLEFVRAGQDMAFRSVDAIANTQEQYRTWMTDKDGLLSAMKKVYRKDDEAEMQKGIFAMRTGIKEEDTDIANQMAWETLLNAIQTMRINSDAESLMGEKAYETNHRKRSAFSSVTSEGDENPLHDEDRNRMVNEYLHSGQFPKRVKEGEQVWDFEAQLTAEEWLGKYGGEVGAQVGSLADKLFGRAAGKYVRNRWKETSGEGMRDRVIAGWVDILRRNGPTYIGLAVLALFLLALMKGFQEAEEG
ncbi:MAG: hypothetical protein Q8P72_03980 [Candidatus Roizmanbacteria bacterium]|nr:hypothetical protein [Candidatus Roizmanbacteria bacterium]